MLHSVKDLLDVVYRHYPRDMERGDPRYEQTEQYARLSAARRKAGAEHGLWRGLLRRIDEQFPENGTQNLSLHLPTGGDDAAYSGRIHLATSPGESFHAIGFFISFLVPYYVVYSLRIVDDIEKTEALRTSPSENVCVFVDDTCFILPRNIVKPEFVEQREPEQAFQSVVRFDFSPDEGPYAEQVAKEIEAKWSYLPMPPEVGKVVVPDVSTNRRMLGEATLYDCLMSDNW